MQSSRFPPLLALTVAAALIGAYPSDALADAACHIGPGVSAGTSTDLRARRQARSFALPAKPGAGRRYRPDEIVAMGIDGENNFVFAWYADGRVSAGTSTDLGARRAPVRYALPAKPGAGRRYRPGEIVGMGIDGENNFVFAWYEDGRVSAGTSTDLEARRAPARYVLPAKPGAGRRYRPDEIVAMGIDGENDFVFAWYADGMVSAGTSRDLGARRAPRRVTRAPAANVRPEDVVGIGIDGRTNGVFVWFVGRDSKVC